MTADIMKRLTQTRQNAGLSQGQVDRLMNWPKGTTKQFEAGDLELNLRFFRLLCVHYGVSEVWALCGVNPWVNVKELCNLLFNAKIARADIDKVLDLLVTLPAEIPSAVNEAAEKASEEE